MRNSKILNLSFSTWIEIHKFEAQHKKVVSVVEIILVFSTVSAYVNETV